MIPNAREIVYAVYGAWRLLRLDPRGMAYFDDSPEGFWKSFFAAVLVAPAHALIVLFELNKMETVVDPVSNGIIQILAYVISWVAFPLAAYHVIQNMDREARYIRYIVAYNWSSIIQMVIFLPLGLLAESGLLVTALIGLISLAAFVVVLAYLWFIARTALDLTGGGATGLVVLSVVIEFFIRGFVDHIIT